MCLDYTKIAGIRFILPPYTAIQSQKHIENNFVNCWRNGGDAYEVNTLTQTLPGRHFPGLCQEYGTQGGISGLGDQRKQWLEFKAARSVRNWGSTSNMRREIENPRNIHVKMSFVSWVNSLAMWKWAKERPNRKQQQQLEDWKKKKPSQIPGKMLEFRSSQNGKRLVKSKQNKTKLRNSDGALEIPCLGRIPMSWD